MILFHQFGERITSIISIAWYFTTKWGGNIWQRWRCRPLAGAGVTPVFRCHRGPGITRVTLSKRITIRQTDSASSHRAPLRTTPVRGSGVFARLTLAMTTASTLNWASRYLPMNRIGNNRETDSTWRRHWGSTPTSSTTFSLVTGLIARDARAMNTALWPATLGYFLEEMMEPLFAEETLRQTRQFFLQHVERSRSGARHPRWDPALRHFADLCPVALALSECRDRQ